MSAKYIESKIDNDTYCITNGQFTKHLRKHNLTYQEYYEKFITMISPKCHCGKSLTFYQNTHLYAKSCGDPVCVGKIVSYTRQNISEDLRLIQSENYKKVHKNRTKEQVNKLVQQRKDTYRQRYGTTPSNSLTQKAKSAKTKLEKYGDPKYNNSKQSASKNRAKTLDEQELINDRRRKTNLERFGVENPVLGCVRNTNRGNASVKEYILPSGKKIGVRGDEPKALNLIFGLGHNENNLIVHDNYQPAPLNFEYTAVNRHKCKYYPDIYIPEENKIIEVKSWWWWNGNGGEKYKSRLENNLRKRKAVLAAGYIYEVWIFERRGNLKVLVNDTDF